MNFDALLNPGVLIMLIPVLAVTGWIVTTITRHRERMALIERGIDPDSKTAVLPESQPRSSARQ